MDLIRRRQDRKSALMIAGRISQFQTERLIFGLGSPNLTADLRLSPGGLMMTQIHFSVK
jgi:hypothetical protein